MVCYVLCDVRRVLFAVCRVIVLFGLCDVCCECWVICSDWCELAMVRCCVSCVGCGVLSIGRCALFAACCVVCVVG